MMNATVRPWRFTLRCGAPMLRLQESRHFKSGALSVQTVDNRNRAFELLKNDIPRQHWAGKLFDLPASLPKNHPTDTAFGFFRYKNATNDLKGLLEAEKNGGQIAEHTVTAKLTELISNVHFGNLVMLAGRNTQEAFQQTLFAASAAWYCGELFWALTLVNYIESFIAKRLTSDDLQGEHSAHITLGIIETYEMFGDLSLELGGTEPAAIAYKKALTTIEQYKRFDDANGILKSHPSAPRRLAELNYSVRKKFEILLSDLKQWNG